MKKSFVEVAIFAEMEERKAAFAKFNRVVNLDNAKAILEVMKDKGYKGAEIIQVIKAEDALAKGDVDLVDINGNPISEEDAVNYFLIMDGQHRTVAVALYNEWAEVEEKEALKIPAVIVELKEDESIAEYINEINITKKEWATPDYVRGALNINPDIEFLKRYNEHIKSDANPKGISLSTLNHIYCGASGAINKKDFSLLCSGITQKGSKVVKPVIPPHNLENGDRFIAICLDKGFNKGDIGKRYLITEFNTIKTEAGSVQAAFEVFESITPNDKAAMFNEKENLDETLIIKQFSKIKARVLKKKETANKAA